MYRISEVLHGAATLCEILDCIGNDNGDDQTITKLVIEHEITLRTLLEFAIGAITDEIEVR